LDNPNNHTSLKNTTMNPESFINNMQEAFDNRVDNLTLDSDFRTLAEWDSLASVSTVAMIYAEYDVQVSGDELVACSNLSELMRIIEDKQAESS
jgi:acyl carrier protein